MEATIAGFMGEDHDRLDRLFLKFRGAKYCDPGGAREFFSDFCSGLLRHIAWEEEVLFLRFEERTGMRHAGPTVVMRMEHKQIKDFLDRIGTGLAADGVRTDEWEAGLETVLKEHNRKEEGILYPAMDRILGEAEAKEALEKLRTGESR